MTLDEATQQIRKGKAVTRKKFKRGGRYTCKIVNMDGVIRIWSKTTIPGVSTWSALEKLEDLEPEHVEASDWVTCSWPS